MSIKLQNSNHFSLSSVKLKQKMAQRKTKKRNHTSSSKKTIPTEKKPWPSVSPQVIRSIERHGVSFGRLIKSWISPPRRCFQEGMSQWPQLVQITGNRRVTYHENVTSFVDTSDVMNVVLEAHFSDSCLWEETIKLRRSLPRKDPDHQSISSKLRSSRNDPYAWKTIAVTGTCYPDFMFTTSGWHGREWSAIKVSCGSKPHMQFTNVIAFQTAFYALSLQGSLVVMEETDCCFTITGIGGNRAVPSKMCRQFWEYLFGYNGEILLLFLMSRKSISVVEDVEVFRLDIPKLLWVKVESLGENTLFVSEQRISGVNGSEVGCRSNCIFFTNHRLNSWFLYEMETGQISLVS